jgi:hypothetical protein
LDNFQIAGVFDKKGRSEVTFIDYLEAVKGWALKHMKGGHYGV